MSTVAAGPPPAEVRPYRLARARLRLGRLVAGRRELAPALADGGAVGLPPAPPACPASWRTGPPDFVGVGAQRSGTTRWFDLISAHPEVQRPGEIKEVHFFDRFYAGGCTSEALARYERYFPREGTRKAGEWTPLYASLPWAAQLLAAVAPEARLLMLVRDPVERFLSGLQRDLDRAARRSAPLSRYVPLTQLARGFYHAHLMGLMRHFSRAQILVLQYERCTLEPAAELRRTFAFLGLADVSFLPELDAHPERQPHKPALDEPTRRAYAEAYREDVMALMEGWPELDVSLWPNFASLAS